MPSKPDEKKLDKHGFPVINYRKMLVVSLIMSGCVYATLYLTEGVVDGSWVTAITAFVSSLAAYYFLRNWK